MRSNEQRVRGGQVEDRLLRGRGEQAGRLGHIAQVHAERLHKARNDRPVDVRRGNRQAKMQSRYHIAAAIRHAVESTTGAHQAQVAPGKWHAPPGDRAGGACERDSADSAAQ